MATEFPSFLSCDWGTTSFRLRLVNGETGEVLRETNSGKGVKEVFQNAGPDRACAFHDHLAEAVRKLLGRGQDHPELGAVVVSGMASSSVGWHELPYATTPFRVDGSDAGTKRMELDLGEGGILPVVLVSGLATNDEIMRGEETQIMGLLAMPAWEGLAEDALVILPGTHCKHVRAREGRIIGFQTYMTGELFEVLVRHSILSFTTSQATGLMEKGAFQEGVRAAGQRGLAGSLFQVRTRGVLNNLPAPANRAYLSGLLIGTEWTELGRKELPGQIFLAAHGSLADLYRWAAEECGWGGKVLVAGEKDMSRALVEGHRLLLQQCMKA